MSKFNFIDNFTAGFARRMLFGGTPFFGSCGFWGNPFYSHGLCISSFMYPSVFNGCFTPLLPPINPPSINFVPKFEFNFNFDNQYDTSSISNTSSFDFNLKTNTSYNFDNSNWNFDTIGDSFTRSSNSSKSTDSTIAQNSDNLDLSKHNYNADKGLRLAKQAKKNATGWEHLCATHVKQDIEACGLGKYEKGDAYQCVDILNRNSNFKRINSSGVDVSKLPAGCVLIYGKGVAGYDKNAGHIEITLGNGKAASDGITNNIRQNPTAIFIPV